MAVAATADPFPARKYAECGLTLTPERQQLVADVLEVIGRGESKCPDDLDDALERHGWRREWLAMEAV